MKATPLNFVPSPTTPPIWAVFIDRAGDPYCQLVVGWALMEIVEDDGKSRRLVAGFATGDHVECCDYKDEFVGYTNGETPEQVKDDREWKKRCKTRLAGWQAAEKREAQQKIIVPNQEPKVFTH